METWTSTDSSAFAMLTAFGNAVHESGLESPSLRAIAVQGRCSHATLRNWFGTKGELHRRLLLALGVKWGHFLSGTLLPRDEMGAFYARVRLAFDELARTDPAVGAVLDDLVELERGAIERHLYFGHRLRRPDPRSVAVVHALLLRLWDVRAYPDRDVAERLLDQVMTALFGRPRHRSAVSENEATVVRVGGYARTVGAD